MKFMLSCLVPGGGQGGIGNLANTGSQLPGVGQGGIGNLANTGSQLPGVGQGGIGNLANTGSQLPGVGQGGIGNLANTGSQLPGVGQGGIGNLANTGSQLPGVGQGGIGNLPNTGSQRDETNIERPCQSFDIYCIRRYFKKNSKCQEVLGPVPDPYYRAQSTLQFPVINATFSAFDVLYSGLNGRIVEFYINRDTDRLVIAVEFRNVTFYSKDVFFRFFRRAKEPITTFDYLYQNYQSFITTTIIPKIRNLQFARSKTNTFTNDAAPSFSIGPNAFNYPDPAVQGARASIILKASQLTREAQLTEGPFTAAIFIQNNICNFHLKVL
ncbi:uncharacterized protein LOC133319709 [Danaus plexippus]|uniref:uncharacterized protein LOC133319709 n=1 Tax=Danaus plexippus TaxID=13037 RepID=UPI002AB2AE13|nr:uncharacterized protein LOC133319709 [Danaus plexippus]